MFSALRNTLRGFLGVTAETPWNSFDFSEETSSDSSFSGSILKEMRYYESIEKIKSLASDVEFLRQIPDDAREIEPGTVYLFYVDVFCQKNELKVREKDPSQKGRFFHQDLDKATRVILICSKSIRATEAKLAVYREYEKCLGSQNILLLHEFDDVVVEISKLSGKQKLKRLLETLKVIEESIPVDELTTILQNAAAQTLVNNSIKEICYQVNLEDAGHHIGTVNSNTYYCYSVLTVRRIKNTLVHQTLEDLANSLTSKICLGILQHIESKIKTKMNIKFKGLELSVSGETFLRIRDVLVLVVVTIITSFYGFLVQVVAFTVWAVVTMVWPVNINSRDWRQKVADEIYAIVSEKKDSVLREILTTVTNMCMATRSDLKEIIQKIVLQDTGIIMSDQKELVRLWKKREVIRDRKALREACPTFLHHIAGEKNGKSVVVIFLQGGDSRKANDYFTKNAQISGALFEFVDVNSGLRETAGTLKKKSEHSIDKCIKETILGIIEKDGEKILSVYSNVIGFGVDCMSTGHNLNKPCIVLYCLDKSLIPYGEKKLPPELGGYPVDLRDEFFMFGHWVGSPHLNSECGIKRASCEFSGSIGFIVKSRKPSLPSLSKRGFLTAADLALAFAELYKEEALLINNPFPESAHEIFHPLIKDNGEDNIEVNVAEAVSGNFDPESERMNTACVKLSNVESIDLWDIQVVNVEDLTEGETFVTTTGRTTRCTNGILVEIGSTIAIDLPLTPGKFACFRNCYIIHHPDVTLFKEDGLCSGVYINERMGQPKKTLGIALAMLKGKKHTVVWDIKNIFKNFKVTVYQKQKLMNFQSSSFDNEK